MASPPKQATARIRGRPDEKGDNVIAPAHSVSTMDATEPGSRLESETTVPPPQQSSVKAVSTLGSAVGSATSLKELPLFAKRTRNCFSTMPVTFVLLLISVLYSIFVGVSYREVSAHSLSMERVEAKHYSQLCIWVCFL
eukprot:GHVN01008969.1.p3 GENE.GHVN01008969.1~~GHVN01008969.1.p3  ORF type:complete len:139 (-),score=20.11 GHVN01008969.1:1251-1667(-)